MKELKISEAVNIKVNGRTTESRDPLTLIWTGSSLELNVQCTELWVEMAGPYSAQENWIAIEINGEVISRRMVGPEREWVCIFRNKMNTKPTRVRIIKEVQAMSADEEHRLEFYALRCDGELLPVPEKKLKIEFIGDSLNSGEGSIGAKEEEEWISMFFSHVNSYPYMTAKLLDADYRVFSQSGWGLYISWDGNTECAVPRYYEDICSLMPEKRFKASGFYEKNDFNAWQPDIICVNLGTNDNEAIKNTGFTDTMQIRNAAAAFLKKLRNNNPGAYIIWCMGMLGDNTAKYIKEGIGDHRKESGDERVEYLALPDTEEGLIGARFHPGVKAHERAASIIAARIRELLG